MAPPFAAVLLGPFWPFGRWQCDECHSRLRFRLIPFYVFASIAMLPAIVLLLLLSVFGLADSAWGFAAVPLYWATLYWLAAKVIAVDVEP